EYFTYYYKNAYAESSGDTSTMYYMYRSCTSDNMFARYIDEDNNVQYEFIDLSRIVGSDDSNDINYIGPYSMTDTGDCDIITYNGYFYFCSENDYLVRNDYDSSLDTEEKKSLTFAISPKFSTVDGQKTITNTKSSGNNITSAKYVINFDKPNSLIQKMLHPAGISTPIYYTGNGTVDGFNYYGQIIDNYFYDVTISKTFDISTDSNDYDSTGIEYLSCPVVEVKSFGFNFFKFTYNRHDYYYNSANGKTYNGEPAFNENNDGSYSIDWSGAVELPSTNPLGLANNFVYDFATSMTVKLERPYIDFLGTRFYYSFDAEDVLFYDFGCNDEADLCAKFGFESYSVDPDGTGFDLTTVRYTSTINGTTYYVFKNDGSAENQSKAKVYSDYNCSNPYPYDDAVSIEGNYDDVKLMTFFSSHIYFNVSQAGYSGEYLFTDASLQLKKNSDNTPVTTFTYYKLSIEVVGATPKISFEVGSKKKTDVKVQVKEPTGSNYGVAVLKTIDLSSSTTFNFSAASGKLTYITDIYEGIKDTRKYFSATKTSIVAESYLTQMNLSSFIIKGEAFVIQDGTDTDPTKTSIYFSDKFDKDYLIADKIVEDVFTGKEDPKPLYYSTEIYKKIINRSTFTGMDGETAKYSVSTLGSPMTIHLLYNDSCVAVGYIDNYVLVKQGTSSYFKGQKVAFDATALEIDLEGTKYKISPQVQVGSVFDIDGLDSLFIYYNIGTIYQLSEINSASLHEESVYTITKGTDGDGLPSYQIKFLDDDSHYSSVDFCKTVVAADDRYTSYYSVCYSYYGNQNLIEQVDGSNVNVYYSTTPYAKHHETTDIYGITTSDIIYFYAISNFSELLRNDSIMLGKDIAQSTSANAKNFMKLVGAKIISSYYYYILPFTDADKKAVQIIQEPDRVSNGTMEFFQTKYYYEGAEYQGTIYKKETFFYETTVNSRNPFGTIADLTGWSSNINESIHVIETIDQGQTYNGKRIYSITSPKTSVVYYLYYDTFNAGTVYELFSSINNLKSGNKLQISAVGYDVKNGKNRILLNYISYNIGNESGYLYTDSVGYYINDSISGQVAEGSNYYSLVSNLLTIDDDFVNANKDTIATIYRVRNTNIRFTETEIKYHVSYDNGDPIVYQELDHNGDP
ncbi:MAG: hypothetical protein IJA23_01860, partial [Clostridia bacterium]|nr:hypothetical protein [Clostridia bacterium]